MAEPGSPTQPEDAQLDLLVEQVTAGLSPEEARALGAMDDALADAYLRDFERAVAVANVALSAGNEEPMPAALRARIERDAQSFFGKGRVTPSSSRREEGPASAAPAKRASTAGWFVAAACLVLALLGWLRPLRPASAPPTANMPATTPAIKPPVRVAHPPPAPPAPTPTEERAALLAKPGVVVLNLGGTKDPAAAGVNADVVWDPATQRGFLHIVGLRPNDPQIQQYQAWIFDADRDKHYPLAAGLFDAPADSTEVFIPLHSDLPVHRASAFAVTLEQSGGAVVPALKHVIALGKVS
jgi:hypothetical protein